MNWEISWRKNHTISEGKQGYFQKIKSWFTNEGVELAIQGYLAGAGESNSNDTTFHLVLTMALEISAYGLAGAVGNYVESAQATDAIYRILPPDEEVSSRIESRYSGKV